AVGLERLPEYTAIVAANDEVALGIVHGLHDRGLRVPDDLSVAGFDDAPFSRHSIPPLTTVRQPFETPGGTVVDVLLAAIEGLEIPRRTKIPPEPIVSPSTAKARTTPCGLRPPASDGQPRSTCQPSPPTPDRAST